MAIEVFTQLTATGDQMAQMYALRKRYCIDLLGWQGRTVWRDLEYDDFDTPAAVYVVWRKDGIARCMVRFTPCDIEYMISKNWPHLVVDTSLPSRPDQWELTRFCLEPSLTKEEKGDAVYEVCYAANRLAAQYGISEYWWIAPQFRLNAILPHNHKTVGPSQLLGVEECFAGYSDAKNMINPTVDALRRTADKMRDIELKLPPLPRVEVQAA